MEASDKCTVLFLLLLNIRISNHHSKKAEGRPIIHSLIANLPLIILY